MSDSCTRPAKHPPRIPQTDSGIHLLKPSNEENEENKKHCSGINQGYIPSKKKRRRQIDIPKCKSISSYMSQAQNVLISLRGGTVNKMDHYKIHEFQKS